MARHFFPFFILFLSQTALTYSQQSKKPGTKSNDIMQWDLRNYTVQPCFQSERLESLIQKAWDGLKKKDSTASYFFMAGKIKLSESDFESLTPKEKFIYAHKYPESYLQTCGLYDMAKDKSMIHANIPYLFDGERMSERQIKSLQSNRDSAMIYLGQCLSFTSHIPLGYKSTIIEINAWEFIPSILGLEEKMNNGDAATIQDTYIYSLLMVLMKNGEFEDFKKTTIYKTLYSPDSGYREKMKFTGDIRKQLRKLSQKFYLSKLSETNKVY